MISYTQALSIIDEYTSNAALDRKVIHIQDSAGRICAEDIHSPLNIQPFDNSAMDGFAVQREDLKEANEHSPVILTKNSVIAAGQPRPTSTLVSGTCAHIMTGAPVPPGADAVVPIEKTQINDDSISFFESPTEHANIRFAGEDFKNGQKILSRGDRLNTSHILPLATLGIDTLPVYKKPTFIFISTGEELVDDLSKPLQDGQIYDSNRPYAVSFLEQAGFSCLKQLSLKDNTQAFAEALESLMHLNPDFIISSGAVSAGAFDFVKDGIDSIGAKLLYHKMKIKPGKPNLLAELPNGTLYFGLPGNPVATAVGLRFLVNRAAQNMHGLDMPPPVCAQTTTTFHKKPGLQMFLKGTAKLDSKGYLNVTILDGQASFMVSPFLDMNCWVSMPDTCETINAGDIVKIYPLMPYENIV